MADFYYHRCGYPIIVEFHPAGMKETVVFRDGGTQYDRDPDPIEDCPGCGQVLVFGDIIAEVQE